eukprot:747164-Hanusia_phi.AAC.3
MTALEQAASCTAIVMKTKSRESRHRYQHAVLAATVLCLLTGGWLLCDPGKAASQETGLSQFSKARQLIANVKGREKVLEDAFREDEREDKVITAAYQIARARIRSKLQAKFDEEVEQELERKLHPTIPKSTYLYKIGSNILDTQQELDDGRRMLDHLRGLSKQIDDMEESICNDVSCDGAWQRIQQGLQGKDEIRQELQRMKQEHANNEKLKRSESTRFERVIGSMRNTSQREDEEIEWWKQRADNLRARLEAREANQVRKNATTARPTHCHGLLTMVGRRGTIATGTGPVPDPSKNDCRWIIKSDKDFHIYGTSGRLSIFAGPNDVARYRNEDVRKRRWFGLRPRRAGTGPGVVESVREKSESGERKQQAS